MYEIKDFPPSIQELLKKRGWNWPPDKELYHDECVDFRDRLKAEGALSVVGDFIYEELAFFLVRKALETEGKKTGRHSFLTASRLLQR